MVKDHWTECTHWYINKLNGKSSCYNNMWTSELQNETGWVLDSDTVCSLNNQHHKNKIVLSVCVNKECNTSKRWLNRFWHKTVSIWTKIAQSPFSRYLFAWILANELKKNGALLIYHDLLCNLSCLKWHWSA